MVETDEKSTRMNLTEHLISGIAILYHMSMYKWGQTYISFYLTCFFPHSTTHKNNQNIWLKKNNEEIWFNYDQSVSGSLVWIKPGCCITAQQDCILKWAFQNIVWKPRTFSAYMSFAAESLVIYNQMALIGCRTILLCFSFSSLNTPGYQTRIPIRTESGYAELILTIVAQSWGLRIFRIWNLVNSQEGRLTPGFFVLCLGSSEFNKDLILCFNAHLP